MAGLKVYLDPILHNKISLVGSTRVPSKPSGYAILLPASHSRATTFRPHQVVHTI